MTFAISLFIIIMQFVWKYVEEFVGKGLETHILGELFFYVAITFVPMALPLAILLASLMAFGNLGESSELIAIKAAGISLLKAMRPLIVLISLISVGAFFFQDDVIPKANVKMRTLLISIRQKSPDLDIPENTFYSGINNYNLFVKKKDPKTGMLYDLMIYDVSKGFDNMAVIVCDSGKMEMSAAKDNVILTLYNGQDFRNFQQSDIGNRPQNYRSNKFVPYARENFKVRQVIIPFDANFTRIDESTMEGTQFAKNVSELRHSIDSLSVVIDSLNIADRRMMLKYTYLSYRNQPTFVEDSIARDVTPPTYDMDSILNSMSFSQKTNIYNSAVSKAENTKNDYLFRSLSKINSQSQLRRHDVELQRKFVLSFACLIFFFIGAPLGAIIRKGGLGMPVVISVILFIIYYIIDNVGYKMARDGVWEVWQGVWLSSFVLFPLGVFITYKAINDSALFNPEAYTKYIRRILFITAPQKMTESKYESMVNEIPSLSELNLEPNIEKGLLIMDSDDLRGILENKDRENDINMRLGALSILKTRGADLNTFIQQQDEKYADGNMNFFSRSSLLTIIAYITLLAVFILKISLLVKIIGVIYLILFLRSMIYYSNFYGKINKKIKLYNTLIGILSLLFYPAIYLLIMKRMKKYKKNMHLLPDTQIN